MSDASTSNNAPWSYRKKAITICAVVILAMAIGSIYNGFWNFGGLFQHIGIRTHFAQQQYITEGNLAINDAAGRQWRRHANDVVHKIDNEEIQDPEILQKEIEGAREKIRRMQIVANGGILPDANSRNCKGREVLANYVLKLEVMPSCTAEFETIIIYTDKRMTYKVEFLSGEGDPIAVTPTFTRGRGSIADYNSDTKTLIAEGSVFYHQRKEDVGKHRILKLTPIS